MLNWLLPIAFAVLAVFTLVKDWTGYKKSWRRAAVLGLIIAIGVCGAINNWIRDEDVRDQTGKLRGEIVGLKASVEIAYKSQQDNTEKFLKQFDRMTRQVSDLQSKVKTEELQKEAAELKAQLAATQKALVQPKAGLIFSFAKPYLGAPAIRAVTLPVKDGVVHVEFTMINLTDVPALDGEVTIEICNDCKFASEPSEFRKLPGMKDTRRIYSFDRILQRTQLKNLSADIEVPPKGDMMQFGVFYRCQNCIIPSNESSIGIVTLDRQPRPAN